MARYAGIFVLILLVFFSRAPKRDVPDDLLGEWQTSDPYYSDRSFEITPVSISFTPGGLLCSTGVIKEVKSASGRQIALYTPLCTTWMARATKSLSIMKWARPMAPKPPVSPSSASKTSKRPSGRRTKAASWTALNSCNSDGRCWNVRIELEFTHDGLGVIYRCRGKPEPR